VIWRLHEAAQEELREAALWYEDEQRYYVAYEIVGNEIVVLAVAHTKRRPGYWVGRR